MQLEGHVSCFTKHCGSFLGRLTALVPLVVPGNLDDHWCHAEELVVANLTEDGYAVRRGLAARYATALPPPTHHSVPAHETGRSDVKRTGGVSWYSNC